jgi:hypothetical protein
MSRLLVARRFARRRYGSCANVLAVGIGAKFKRRTPGAVAADKVAGLTCIQFFVTHKEPQLKPRQRLPGFVYRRFVNGRVDYRGRIPTDVIPVGEFRTACRAGSPLDANGDHGLITLIFRNKVSPRNRFYLISCAHVAGDIHRSPPPYDQLISRGSNARPFARTLVNATATGNAIEYDIALAKIEDHALPLPELRIRGTRCVLDSFFPSRLIQPGLGVSAVLRRHSTRGTVDSLQTTASVRYGRETFRVHHLFGINAAAGEGDSGGLVYRGTRAVGIVVAASPQGWFWFQPLEPAIAFLNRIAPIRLSLFNPKHDNSSPNPDVVE